ncbi:MAG: 23S rRNA pseudouridine(955/2504/2580) synthase RluC [Gammaproteobacteria bacterium]|nr:23S rRNA pseudouridine(955/2504/2580) synthase RluC [Gammaproteobacteria bacterium]NNJ92830.1 23S rRNA pseudouridine(955/2504/2580) synthase RluC [Gammaproteobacteria bacterium]
MPEVTGKKVRIVAVDAEFSGQRLDNFLLRELKGVPRSLIYKIVRRGEVRVNKGRANVKYRLQTGDQVRIPPVRQSSPQTNMPHKGLQDSLAEAIIYEDKQLLVINKPSGMAVHGGSGISFGVIETLRAMRPQEKSLELVHRLDRDTSGCLMVAKKRSMLKILHDLQREDGIEKKYLALVHGNWGKKTEITVDAPLKKNTLKGGERIVQVDAAGKHAVTHFKILETYKDAMLVQAILETGRTHQIRVHLQHAGTPILGDLKYGDGTANKIIRQNGLYRLFLHAVRLTFTHPESGKLFQFHAPLDSELESLLAVLR